MNKILLFGSLLVLFVGCSDKNQEVKPKIKKVTELNVSKELNSTKELNTTKKSNPISELNSSKANMMVVPEEFIPEHIKHSTIEVVEHY